jgi:hypothetical protein
MDYIIDTRDFGDRAFALIVTKWVNLGAGLDPRDGKWQSHLQSALTHRVVDPLHLLGEIRGGFEGQAELSVEELTADNERKLFLIRKTRRVYRRKDGCVWRWNFGK